MCAGACWSEKASSLKKFVLSNVYYLYLESQLNSNMEEHSVLLFSR